ncbi:surfeit locus protein 6 isoform X2 [Antennarius striatus]|uniref:surfeit locus protein 6 isoform X2 n=1 Tax=Antennarius striatus TaxID=241820 RepID=UPI0035ADBBD7
MDLTSRASHLQRLASSVRYRDREPANTPPGHVTSQQGSGPPGRKRRRKKKRLNEEKTPEQEPPRVAPGDPVGPQSVEEPTGSAPRCSTTDFLRRRLRERIQVCREQGAPCGPPSEVLQAKRAKRQLERERRKRKRKAFRMKELVEGGGAERGGAERGGAERGGPEPPLGAQQEAEPRPALLFNRVETVDERFVDQIQRKKARRRSVKGHVTPLTGRNYQQLLGRVAARRGRLLRLQDTHPEKALQLEQKVRWTNLLYKAEGVRIRDDEDMLRAALHRKEKRRAHRKSTWGARSAALLDKMQQRQDKRRKNIQRRQKVRADRKREGARRRGRLLPGDLRDAP